MSIQKIKVFTHSCIEGHTCAALLKTSFDCEVKYETCTSNNLIEHLKAFFEKEEKSAEKSFIFITDLNIGDVHRNDPEVQEILDEISKRGNVMLLDHHESAKWIMNDERINAYIDHNKKSASHIVHDTLKANTLNKTEREKLGLDGLPEFPVELSNHLIYKDNNEKLYDMLKEFDSTIDVIDDIDSGKPGHEDVLFLFHASRKKFVEQLVENHSIELSEEQKKQYTIYEAQRTKKIKDFMRKALDGKAKIATVVKDEKGLTYVKTICPIDRDITACDIAREFAKSDVEHDYIKVFRMHEVKNDKVPVSIFSNNKDVSAVELASEYGGGGHREAARCDLDVQSVGIVNDNGEYAFVQESMKVFGLADSENKSRIPQGLGRAKDDGIAFAL